MLAVGHSLVMKMFMFLSYGSNTGTCLPVVPLHQLLRMILLFLIV